MEEELDRGFNVFQDYFFKNVLRIPQDLDLHPNYCKGIELNMTQEHENLLDLHLEQMRTDIVNVNHCDKRSTQEIDINSLF